MIAPSTFANPGTAPTAHAPINDPAWLQISRIPATPKTLSTVAIFRNTASNLAHQLSDAQIKNDPIAVEAAHWGNNFLGWASQYGWQPKKPTAIVLDGSMTDSANATVSIGKPQMLLKHMARSPEVVGHELGHAVFSSKLDIYKGSIYNKVLGEGIADVVGHAFARSTGYKPALENWRPLDELARPGENAQVKGRRDLANPTIKNLDDALEYTRTNDQVDPHKLGEPVAFAYVKLVDKIGDADATKLAMRAITDRLPALIEQHPLGTATSENFIEQMMRKVKPEEVATAFHVFGEALRSAAEHDSQRTAVTDVLTSMGMT